jgi:hypothetical protein
MPAGSDGEGDLVRDPQRGPAGPGGFYAYGVLGVAILLAAWWAGSATTGVVRVVCRVVGVAAGLYGVYLLVISAGMHVLTCGVSRYLERLRRSDATGAGERLLELRLPYAGDMDPSMVDELVDEIAVELDGAGECDELHGGAGTPITYYLHGPSLARMTAAVRRAAERYPLPADAYLWVPSQERRGFGRLLDLRDDA